jgi:hypothetical protein
MSRRRTRDAIDGSGEFGNVPVMRSPWGILIAVVALSAAVSACGSGSGTTTASILGTADASPASAQAQVQAPAKPVDPAERATQVAAVSARAEKCGFYFDAAKLRASYLAAEARETPAPDALNKAERAYDYTYSAVKTAIAGDADFCSERKVREVKADLNRHLAGDFSTPQKKVAAKSGWFDWVPPANTREVLNPEWVNDPTNQKRTKRVED